MPKPVSLYLWCAVIIRGLLLCNADKTSSNDHNNVTTSLHNLTSSSIEHETGMASRFFLFQVFRGGNRKKRDTRRGQRRREVKEKTAALASKMNEKLEEARRMLLDRMAAVSFNLISYENDAAINNSTEDGSDDDITPQSDLTLPNRSIYVVTTAALPWRTGTAVNPLLRAAYLSRRMKSINSKQENETTSMYVRSENTTKKAANAVVPMQYVTLVIPWLELEEDRLELYGSNHTFTTSQEQEDYIRDWLQNANMLDEADSNHGLKILFYPARYHSGLKSIFAMGDICAVLKAKGGDLSNAVCILEEPEHLNWYRAPGEGWTKVFNYVVGIIHTNYIEYASGQFHGLWTAPAIQVMSSAMIRAYCHKVIKLSGVLQAYAPEKEVIANVHGVREDFIREGKSPLFTTSSQNQSVPLDEECEGQVYFIGKILWAKGFDIMLELQEFYYECTGNYFAIDIIGDGPDLEDIKRAFHGRPRSATTNEQPGSMKSPSIHMNIPKTFHELFRKKSIPARFLGPMDHASLGAYKVFVNPSISEVLCTTTFEALSMGKWVLIPHHESNSFFLKFPNCLSYRNRWEFAASLRWALTHEPEPLTPELANEFTWEAATDRLIQSAAITRSEAKRRAILGTQKLDERILFLHSELGKGKRGDTLRKVFGGGPVAEQVRYEMIQQGIEESITEKFKKSSFLQAIKSSFININAQPPLQPST